MDFTKIYKDVYDELYDEANYEPQTRGSLLSHKRLIGTAESGTLNIEKNKKGRLLDVGCARGYYLSNVKRDTELSVFGLDISSTAIEDCKNKGINDVIVSSATKISYPNNFFDIVHSSDVLEHLFPQDRSVAVKEIYRILKKGGTFYGNVSTTYEKDKKSHKKALKKFDLKDLHIDPISAEEWLAIFKDNMFLVEWHDIFHRHDCRDEKEGFTTSTGQCHVNFTCKKD